MYKKHHFFQFARITVTIFKLQKSLQIIVFLYIVMKIALFYYLVIYL